MVANIVGYFLTHKINGGLNSAGTLPLKYW